MLNNGQGTQVTASDTTARWVPDASGAESISMTVVGSNAVYFLANLTTAEFDTAYTAEKTIRVQPGMTFTFNGRGRKNIQSVCYRTASATSDVDIAAF